MIIGPSQTYMNRSNEDGFDVAVLAYKLFDFLPTTLIEIAVCEEQ